ncbi:MFS transporter [Actinacidiphila yeochonensis]|uniref:MFS transporter n=1 Tax=Actinacidiphila yeochonensis TaxID=89050 RepID=UPI000AC48245|nr:MFS transporter [Actinacidiphila yeochonensis]
MTLSPPRARRPPRPRFRLPEAYRPLLASAGFRRLVPALAASDLGDGMSVVAVPWLALQLAPQGRSGLFVGAAVAAYALPGALGALVLGPLLRRFPAPRLLAADAWLRALLLGCVPLARAAGVLHPAVYVALLAASSVLHAWGGAGKYALLARMLPPEHRLAANSLVGASASASVVAGPALAGLLVAAVGPVWLIGADALSFAVLALQVGRLGRRDGCGGHEHDGGRDAAKRCAAAVRESGADPAEGRPSGGGALLRRRPELLGILALTWCFNALYGPVEVALPLHVTQDLHAGASLLGLYWTLFGAGAVLGGLAGGALRRLPLWPAALGIVAGWGLALLPFGAGAPVAVTVVCFALGGLVYGPFTALTLTLFQDRTPPRQLTAVLAARAAALLTAAPSERPSAARSPPRWVPEGC